MAQDSVELLVIENVTKTFDGHVSLNNVSAKLTAGQILGLIGKSGAGKSVLIHILRGNDDYKPDSGRVLYNLNQCKKCGNLDLPYKGKECTKCGGPTETLSIDFWSLKQDDPLRQNIKGRISIMLQRTFALFGDMTVIENVMEAIPEDVKGDERIKRAIEMLELVDMTHRTTQDHTHRKGSFRRRETACCHGKAVGKEALVLLSR